MDKQGDEYKLWVTMQSVIWYGYIILCNINMLGIARWVFNDCYDTRMTIAGTNGILALFSLWNTVMGFLGFYYTPPEIFMLLIYLHCAHVAYHFANELKDSESNLKDHHPKNALTGHDLLIKTKNFSSVMNRTWYCISYNNLDHDTVCFFEEYTWKNKDKGTANNNTSDQQRGQPVNVYPTWNAWALPNGTFKL